MGRRFPGSAGGGGGGGGDSIGEFNVVKMFETAGSFTWTKPTKIGGSRILVHVCAGGAGHNARNGSSGPGLGWRRRRLRHEIHRQQFSGATETITIGAGATTTNGQGGTTSFAVIARRLCSGDNDAWNEGSNSGGAGANNYGIGGLGLQGDVNDAGSRGSHYAAAQTPVVVVVACPSAIWPCRWLSGRQWLYD